MPQQSKIDQVLDKFEFNETEKKAFKKCLEIIIQGQTDNDMNVENELIKVIRECTDYEV